MTADYVEITPEITPRWRPEAPPPFRCEACCRLIEPSPWTYDRHEAPPFCLSCTRHWSSVSRLRLAGATSGDMRALHRLSAGINLLSWEIHNGAQAAL